MQAVVLVGLSLTSALPAYVDANAVGDPDLRCGTYSLYVGLKGLGFDVGSYESFEAAIGPPSVAGYSMSQLDAAARASGAETAAVKTNLTHLARRERPFACVAHLQTNHFVLISEVGEQDVTLIDPPLTKTIPRATFEQLWDGTALLVAAGPLESEESLARMDWTVPAWVGGVFVTLSLLVGVGRRLRGCI